MRLNEIVFTDAQPVEGYGPGYFRIGGKVVEGPVILSGGGVQGWGGYDDRAPLLELAGEIDVLFVGTGAEVRHLPPDMREELEAAGLGVEVMSASSACRTYNVLLSEGRRVAMAALPV
ncbi:Mth938-like domain-containing protein [Primorskyibacter sedentarius]|uniref:Mth938-like domain-containing protein n=1 Tax=Primorskyibacter sedentarius TaxID=745311 RepID=UPI003EC12C60